jgi:hypothetical protein
VGDLADQGGADHDEADVEGGHAAADGRRAEAEANVLDQDALG